jgi:hypothetical protein
MGDPEKLLLHLLGIPFAVLCDFALLSPNYKPSQAIGTHFGLFPRKTKKYP